jgi:hypothetical protein
MEGKFHLHLMGVGWSVKLTQLCGGGVVLLESEKNNSTFNHTGQTGSEVKLTTFQEKSSQPKSSILAPRLSLWPKMGLAAAHIPAPHGTTLENPSTKAR